MFTYFYFAENNWKECVGVGVLSFSQMATNSKFLSMNIKKMVDLVVNAAMSCIIQSINEDVIQSPITLDLEFTNGNKLYTKLGL